MRNIYVVSLREENKADSIVFVTVNGMKACEFGLQERNNGQLVYVTECQNGLPIGVAWFYDDGRFMRWAGQPSVGFQQALEFVQ